LDGEQRQQLAAAGVGANRAGDAAVGEYRFFVCNFYEFFEADSNNLFIFIRLRVAVNLVVAASHARKNKSPCMFYVMNFYYYCWVVDMWATRILPTYPQADLG
jgi:hypothetical protein